MKRQIIEIDEDKCNGCGQCIPNCQEGALMIIDGKARLISDLFCDGLGACIGHCPRDAIRMIEREAEPYDEKLTMERCIITAGPNTIRAHLKHLKDHGEMEYYAQAIEVLKAKGLSIPSDEDVVDIPKTKITLNNFEEHQLEAEKKKSFNLDNINLNPFENQGRLLKNPAPPAAAAGGCGGGCLGSRMVDRRPAAAAGGCCPGCPGSEVFDMQAHMQAQMLKNGITPPPFMSGGDGNSRPSSNGAPQSQLMQWPVQLHLVSPMAPYLKNADLLVAADCTAFSMGGFHERLLKGKALLIACPKLDNVGPYVDKLSTMITMNDFKSITIARMEVPCCGGLEQIVEAAMEKAGVQVPLRIIVVGIDGSIKKEVEIRYR